MHPQIVMVAYLLSAHYNTHTCSYACMTVCVDHSPFSLPALAHWYFHWSSGNCESLIRGGHWLPQPVSHSSSGSGVCSPCSWHVSSTQLLALCSNCVGICGPSSAAPDGETLLTVCPCSRFVNASTHPTHAVVHCCCSGRRGDPSEAEGCHCCWWGSHYHPLCGHEQA